VIDYEQHTAPCGSLVLTVRVGSCVLRCVAASSRPNGGRRAARSFVREQMAHALQYKLLGAS